MPVPDYQSLMLPMLKVVADQREHSTREIKDALAEEFRLSDADRAEMLPSGNQKVFNNRVGWAKTYLKKAGLIATDQKRVRITARGSEVLGENPSAITARFLERFPEFVEFRSIRRGRPERRAEGGADDSAAEVDATPEEALEEAYQRIRADLESELLQQVKQCSPAFFEQLVVELLVKMGYGGSRQDAGRAVGQSGDGGIDGIIKEDSLGLDIIYLQAKRWENTVGRPEIQKFAGALQGQRARKGVFITTSSFSRDAEEYGSAIETKIVLIDGNRLAKLMVDHDIGVSPVTAYEIKKIDSDYFTEE